jgi:hypothetical protein
VPHQFLLLPAAAAGKGVAVLRWPARRGQQQVGWVGWLLPGRVLLLLNLPVHCLARVG